MENVSQEDDFVYHRVHGEVSVVRVTGNSVCVELKNGNLLNTDKDHLSFSPWPEPNHTRPEPPVKEGWWLTQFKGCTIDEGFLRYVKDGRVFISTESTEIYGYLGDYVFVRYLGHDWTKEQA